jgi:hypothetical protein
VIVTIYAIVEGRTEELFVQELNREIFHSLGANIEARLIGNARERCRRGGNPKFSRFDGDLTLLMKQHGHRPNVVFTTMLDLYGLPPGYPGAEKAGSGLELAGRIEAALATHFAHPRFVPYLQVHELEALLFARPEAFELAFPGSEPLWRKLENIAGQFETPESINDSPETAPSKRILEIFPEYDKVAFGPLLLSAAGITCLRERCPHFNYWLTRLEAAIAAIHVASAK